MILEECSVAKRYSKELADIAKYDIRFEEYRFEPGMPGGPHVLELAKGFHCQGESFIYDVSVEAVRDQLCFVEESKN